MSDKSKIEWTDATWNPVTGCSKVSEGCRNCYAMKFAERFRGKNGHYFEKGFDMTLRPDKLDQPLRWRRPRRIFVNSMSDLFHPEIPDQFIVDVFTVMAEASHHTFQVLTKRPERMKEFLTDPYMANNVWVGTTSGLDDREPIWPLKNVWLGVSVENQKAADERIPLLLETPAAIRFLSCEPLLGPVDLYQAEALVGGHVNEIEEFSANGNIDWVIVGGESGPGARPMNPDWVRSLRDQCQSAGVAFHFKQWGEWAQVHDLRCNEPGIKGKQWFTLDPDTSLCKIGKKAAGRMLDGRTWDEFPVIQS